MLKFGAHVQKAIGNSTFLILERLTTSVLNFVVAIFVARYLGPDAFGALSYSIAFIALLSTIPHLGFGGVVVQRLVQERESEGEIIGSVLGAKMAAALVAFALANILAAVVVAQPEVRLLVFLISFSMLFDVTTAMRLLFEARTDLKSVALVGLFAGLTAAACRAAAVVAEAPLWVFAMIVALQSALAAFGYVLLTRRGKNQRFRLRFRLERANQLIRKSWPLIISSAAAMLYMKIDQFMLGQMVGLESVGIYAVAARLSEFWYFVPIAVAAAIFPRLVELKASDPAHYENRLREILRYLFWLSLAIAIPISLTASQLITFLFGQPYREAGLILAIHVWACPAVFMGMAVEKWFVTEDLLKFLIIRQVIAAGLNILLNFALIPQYGGAGAAVATVVSYTTAYYLSCFTSRKTAVAGKWMTDAMFWPFSNQARSGVASGSRE